MTIPKLLLSTLLAIPARLQAAELAVLVDTSTEMPMARFERGRLAEGIHKDIGQALAGAMGRTAVFVALPRKRIVRALEDGSADVLCSYVPEWLGGSFRWSQAFIPITEVLITARSATRPRVVADVAGQPIGTVLGYSHPELDDMLGKGFIRDDSASSLLNLRKLGVGRVRHVVTAKFFLDYRQKLGDPVLALHPPLSVKHYMGQCAVSPKGKVKLADVDKAIGRLIASNAIPAILARYQ
ncbi:transporter substrate-binding domain-containing protein [Massilia sp. CCM 8733]|uniref:Transporter substrate-binding domain-containing protein n=1 Tax=Massilia mucilaginosa TaxID=2609282 RepID=A0ABX0NQJ4_9BURK|nr:transporter substrate-binding domain-containing protein [Massilia mucilaginosa]NHZ89151.1 transporter substrate-binding domain-containing protein [Massilia mucilaginosa]